MIRRADGDDWLIIPQIDHAHLAGDLAKAWGGEFAAPLPSPELLIPAVRDHDDGWSLWEQQPRIDATTGRPRNFTEMPMDEATAIWTRSINVCAGHGPLGAIWVSLHFRWLAERATTTDARDRKALKRFLAEQSARRRRWRKQAGVELPVDELAPVVDRGLRYLQLFDSMSLWLCCCPCTEPCSATVPDNGILSIEPLSPTQIQIHPYPFSQPELNLRVPARRIAARPYQDDEQLQAALAQAQRDQLEWTLRASRRNTSGISSQG